MGQRKCMTEGCETLVDEKYKFCFPCVTKMKQTNQEVGAIKSDVPSDEVVKALGAINNNLYALRTMQEAILEKEYKLSLRWDSGEKKFLIEKAKPKIKVVKA